MLTMKTKYALKALAYLAKAPPEQPVLIAEIATREVIPKKFLELILAELKQHGFVKSKKGPRGGYLMAVAAEAIPLAAVIRAVEGPIAPVPCLSRTAYARCEGCAEEATCGIRLVLADLYEASVKILESTTVRDLVERTDQAGRDTAPRQLRYFI
ncbi:MAG: Rrf2 family transcriptional regulator [Deltaproteobacteria bacterium]|nr:Rrf2 family transcriptional regulator [Deltaproteobacteria bacterium]